MILVLKNRILLLLLLLQYCRIEEEVEVAQKFHIDGITRKDAVKEFEERYGKINNAS